MAHDGVPWDARKRRRECPSTDKDDFKPQLFASAGGVPLPASVTVHVLTHVDLGAIGFLAVVSKSWTHTITLFLSSRRSVELDMLPLVRDAEALALIAARRRGLRLAAHYCRNLTRLRTHPSECERTCAIEDRVLLRQVFWAAVPITTTELQNTLNDAYNTHHFVKHIIGRNCATLADIDIPPMLCTISMLHLYARCPRLARLHLLQPAADDADPRISVYSSDCSRVHQEVMYCIKTRCTAVTDLAVSMSDFGGDNSLAMNETTMRTYLNTNDRLVRLRIRDHCYGVLERMPPQPALRFLTVFSATERTEHMDSNALAALWPRLPRLEALVLDVPACAHDAHQEPLPDPWRFPSLQSLRICRYTCFPRIEAPQLREFAGEFVPTSAIARVMAGAPQLRALRVTNLDFPAGCGRELHKMRGDPATPTPAGDAWLHSSDFSGKAWPHLTSIEIDATEHATAIANLCAACPRLETLDIPGACGFSGRALHRPTGSPVDEKGSLPTFARIRHLALPAPGLWLHDAIRPLPSLRTLVLWGQNVCLADAAILFQSCPLLEDCTLELGCIASCSPYFNPGPYAPCAPFKPPGASAKYVGRLVLLHMNVFAIRDTIHMLQWCPNVATLSMGGEHMDAVSCLAIVRGAKMQRLEVLALPCKSTVLNPFSSDTRPEYAALANVARAVPSLRAICVDAHWHRVHHLVLEPLLVPRVELRVGLPGSPGLPGLPRSSGLHADV